MSDSENKPTLDELDKELLDQLHQATLNASESCFELKKLCATVIIPAGVLVATFSNKELNYAIFGAGFGVILCFWFADAVGYYYQRKLRGAMNAVWARRAARCSEPWPVPTAGGVSKWRAAFNESMLFYLAPAGLTALACLLYVLGVLG